MEDDQLDAVVAWAQEEWPGGIVVTNKPYMAVVNKDKEYWS